MTQIVLNISDNSIVPGLKKVLSRIGGVDRVHIIKEKTTNKNDSFIHQFRQAVSEARELKKGSTEYQSWEDLMNEL
ncbi:MAG: hypothetical protein J6I72_08640 [Muribaculaceae bacterium]|nr:hypothetical protein [Muribaculaceae bacterium]